MMKFPAVHDVSWRHSAAAVLLTLTALAAAAGGTDLGLPGWLAGITAWLAGALLWPQLALPQKKQASALAGVGLLAFGATFALGGVASWRAVLNQNIPLLGMLCAVSFLQLLTPSTERSCALPRGRGALWRTLFGVHVLGAVINLSAVFIMAEKIGPGGKPSPEQTSVLTRAFLAAAMWSPFFAATAVALTYAPGANPLYLALIGLPFAALLLFLNARDVGRDDPARVEQFAGYPLTPATLYVPLLLAALVAAGHHFFAHWTALSIVSLASLLVVVVSLLGKHGLGVSCQRLAGHAGTRLPTMSGEVILFLSAGFFASGLISLIGTGRIWLPFSHFGPLEAAAVLAAMILLAVLGIHAVISITLVGTLLAPLHPEPLLLATVFVQSWAIGLAAGPLSGIHLAVQGRFGIPALVQARNNVRYCIEAYVAAVVWLALVNHFV